MTLYNLRSPGTITKWDTDGNIEAQYEVSYEGCTCPAGHRHTCHQNSHCSQQYTHTIALKILNPARAF